jgi:membrane associated rhomboid family serine protease
VLPLHDTIPTRRFPVVTVALIALNVLVWLVVQGAGTEPRLDDSVRELAFYPCDLNSSCSAGVPEGQPWVVTAITSMFLHGSWLHLGGNMLFLWIFGNNVEDAMGRLRFPVFYVLGGLAATAAQSIVTFQFGAADAADIPTVGASGAIAAVLGAYIVLYPGATVLTWIAPIFVIPLPAMLYLGIWFVLQLFLGSASFTAPESGGGVAYFAHVGGFAFGLLGVRLFTTRAGRRMARS